MQEIQVYGASRRREPLVLVLVLVLVERSRREPSNGAAIESNRWKPSGGGGHPDRRWKGLSDFTGIYPITSR